MTKNQVEVITSVQRRRRWPISEKERIIAAALEPGAVACEVARAAGIHVNTRGVRKQRAKDANCDVITFAIHKRSAL